MWFILKKRARVTSQIFYWLSGSDLEYVGIFHNLGVYLDKSLSHVNHIDKVLNKYNSLDLIVWPIKEFRNSVLISYTFWVKSTSVYYTHATAELW